MANSSSPPPDGTRLQKMETGTTSNHDTQDVQSTTHDNETVNTSGDAQAATTTTTTESTDYDHKEEQEQARLQREADENLARSVAEGLFEGVVPEELFQAIRQAQAHDDFRHLHEGQEVGQNNGHHHDHPMHDVTDSMINSIFSSDFLDQLNGNEDEDLTFDVLNDTHKQSERPEDAEGQRETTGVNEDAPLQAQPMKQIESENKETERSTITTGSKSPPQSASTRAPTVDGDASDTHFPMDITSKSPRRADAETAANEQAIVQEAREDPSTHGVSDLEEKNNDASQGNQPPESFQPGRESPHSLASASREKRPFPLNEPSAAGADDQHDDNDDREVKKRRIANEDVSSKEISSSILENTHTVPMDSAPSASPHHPSQREAEPAQDTTPTSPSLSALQSLAQSISTQDAGAKISEIKQGSASMEDIFASIGGSFAMNTGDGHGEPSLSQSQIDEIVASLGRNSKASQSEGDTSNADQGASTKETTSTNQPSDTPKSGQDTTQPAQPEATAAVAPSEQPHHPDDAQTTENVDQGEGSADPAAQAAELLEMISALLPGSQGKEYWQDDDEEESVPGTAPGTPAPNEATLTRDDTDKHEHATATSTAGQEHLLKSPAPPAAARIPPMTASQPDLDKDKAQSAIPPKLWPPPMGGALAEGGNVGAAAPSNDQGKTGVQSEKKEKKRRNRMVLSCTECHRRKQQCDRNIPCARCVKRGVPELCHMEAPVMPSRKNKRKREDGSYYNAMHAPGFDWTARVRALESLLRTNPAAFADLDLNGSLVSGVSSLQAPLSEMPTADEQEMQNQVQAVISLINQAQAAQQQLELDATAAHLHGSTSLGQQGPSATAASEVTPTLHSLIDPALTGSTVHGSHPDQEQTLESATQIPDQAVDLTLAHPTPTAEAQLNDGINEDPTREAELGGTNVDGIQPSTVTDSVQAESATVAEDASKAEDLPQASINVSSPTISDRGGKPDEDESSTKDDPRKNAKEDEQKEMEGTVTAPPQTVDTTTSSSEPQETTIATHDGSNETGTSSGAAVERDTGALNIPANLQAELAKLAQGVHESSFADELGSMQGPDMNVSELLGGESSALLAQLASSLAPQAGSQPESGATDTGQNANMAEMIAQLAKSGSAAPTPALLGNVLAANSQLAPAAELWSQVPQAPVETIQQVVRTFQADAGPSKLNLGVSGFRQDDGRIFVPPTTRQVERQLHLRGGLPHEKLPVEGHIPFLELGLRFAYGKDGNAFKEGRIAAVQTVSLTGALRLGATFLSRFPSTPAVKVIYIPNPTIEEEAWALREAGLEIRLYRFFDRKLGGVDWEGMREDLQNAPQQSIVVLHVGGSSPTGAELSTAQWRLITEVVKQQRHIPFFVSEFQGLASGNVDRDAQPLRFMAHQRIPLVLAQNFDAAMGLYADSPSILSIVANTTASKSRIESQLKHIARAVHSHPPRWGAQVAANILGNETVYNNWVQEVKAMSDRLKSIREKLYDQLANRLKTPGTWTHIRKAQGMYCTTLLTPEQLQALGYREHIHLLPEGCFSLGCLNAAKIEQLAKAIDSVIRHPPVEEDDLAAQAALQIEIALRQGFGGEGF